jgi:two-component system LytT family response regulator
MKRSAVIVDDEPQALQKLHRLLGEYEDHIHIVGEAADGLAAVEASNAHGCRVSRYEIPGLGGFGVLILSRTSSRTASSPPRSSIMRSAFGVRAVDYLLKPSIANGVCRSPDGTPPQTQRAQLDEARRQRKLERILVRRASKLVVIPVEDVAVFESEDKLVYVRTAEGRFNLNMSMKEIEERVDPDLFCRVHKQAIIRLSLVREIHALPGGQYLAKLCYGYVVQVGRNYAHEFRSRFG